MSGTLSTAAPYILGLLASGAVGVAIQQIVDRRSAASRARRESSDYRRLELGGDWYAMWESTIEGKTVMNGEPVEARQKRNIVYLRNTVRSDENPDGGFLWTGELRVWDNQHLLGWYVARESNVLSKGTFYYVLHPNGQHMSGRWVGRSYDGDMISGCCVLARSEENARKVVTHLLQGGGETNPGEAE